MDKLKGMLKINPNETADKALETLWGPGTDKEIVPRNLSLL